MKRNIVIFTPLINSNANGQDTEPYERIDSIVSYVDFTASKGTFDTLKSGLLNEGNSTSDIFILKKGPVVQKISVLNKSKNYSEKIIFQNGMPVFVQFIEPDNTKLLFYLIGANAYFKDGNKLTKGNGYYYKLIDSYLSLFNRQLDK